MRHFLAALCIIASASLIGCHTCDVCDDCGGDMHGAYQAAPCTSCGSHAVVQPHSAVPVSSQAH